MTPEQTRSLIHTAARVVEERYVFPDVGASVAAVLRGRSDEGGYAGCAGPADLAEAVTKDLHDASADLHLRVLFHPDGAVGEDDPEAQEQWWAEHARRTAGGVRRVERLNDNIALVEVGPVLCAPEHGGRAIFAAMSLVADADALVLDVRDCRGGSPDGVVLLLSHLFGPEPVRLSDMESREEGIRQFWTLPVLPGHRFGPVKPVAVVVGAQTFSGGEGLAFDLQEHGRAVVIGQSTRGGAHPRIGVVLHPQLELTLPTARSVSPRSGTNWEGVGVRPDLVAPEAEALDVALAHVRAQLA